MHKSKNYDMATQVAMEKLMPKPKVQITISMQGGGGLAGLGDRPISSVYGRPIPRTIYRDNGGGFGYTQEDVETMQASPSDYTYTDPDTFSMSDWDTYGGWRPPTDILGGGKTPEELADIFDNSDAPPEVSSDTTIFYRSAPPSVREKQRLDRATPSFLQFGDPKGRPSAPGYGGLKELQDLYKLGHVPKTAKAIQAARRARTDAEHERTEALRKSELHKDVPAKYRHGFKFEPQSILDSGPKIARPFSAQPRSIRNLPIDFAQGGGLSSVKKSININGQPHKLAWIRPDEASALKAMGGSGKKVDGIPAYFYADQGDYAEVTEDIAEAGVGAYGWDTGETDSYADEQRDIETRTEAMQRQHEDAYSTQESVGRPPQSSGGRGADPRRKTSTGREDYKRPEEYEKDLGKAWFGLGRKQNWDDVRSLWMTQYINRHPGGRRDIYTQKEIDIEDEWEAAKNAPGGLSALAEGFRRGDPLGASTAESFNLVNNQLKKKFQKATAESEEEVALSGGWETDELTREELQDTVKDIDGLDDFIPYNGIDYPAWMPGGLAVGALNFLSRTVIGTGTVAGVDVHVHKDGSVTPISPEDAPGFDRSTLETGSEPIRKRKRRPVTEVTSSEIDVEEEAPAKGTMAELLSRRGPTSKSGLQNLKNVLAGTHPGRDFNIG